MESRIVWQSGCGSLKRVCWSSVKSGICHKCLQLLSRQSDYAGLQAVCRATRETGPVQNSRPLAQCCACMLQQLQQQSQLSLTLWLLVLRVVLHSLTSAECLPAAATDLAIKELDHLRVLQHTRTGVCIIISHLHGISAALVAPSQSMRCRWL